MHDARIMIESRTDRLIKHIQDCYSLRCIPQVHGVVHETLAFVKSMIQIEMNSATDNPVSVVYNLVVYITCS